MRKILYLITELDIGGAEKNLFRLAVAMKGRGWDVEVACLSGRGEVGKWFEEASIPVHYIDMGARARLGWFTRLVKLLRGIRPDILHTFLFHANIAGRLANVFARVPSVVSSVRVAERRRKSHLYVDWLTQRLMDVEICVSEGVREFTKKNAYIAPSRLHVIANPVEPLEPVKPRSEVRASLGAADKDTIVLSVGRLDVQKGYEYLIEAAANLLPGRPDLLFVVAGEGDRRDALEKLLDERGISGRFRLIGWRRDVADLYAAADVFVLPSLWEGMPNSILEAATLSLPIVATSVEGTREVIRDGETGLLVPPRDAGALEDAIGKLVDNESQRKSLGAAARQDVLSRHSVELFADEHERIYRELPL